MNEEYSDIWDCVHQKRYKRGILLGKGAFGKCFEVIDMSTGRVYAGKIISKALIQKQCHGQKLLQEVSIHRSLKHKHIVEFYGFFDDISNIYILLELCHKRSMLELMKRRKVLTDPEVRYYMKQILLAIQYLHDCYIIHRDLKLGNILINDDMVVKVGDFGFATKIDNSRERKKTLCGTPNYVAPEILEKKGHGLEVDIWSFGCIFYTLLVGKPPFEGLGIRDTYSRIQRCSYCIPIELNQNAASMLRRIFVRDPLYRPNASALLNNPYFTKEYLPLQLPPSCLMTEPYFKKILKPSSKDVNYLLNTPAKSNSVEVLCAIQNQLDDTLKQKPENEIISDEVNEDPKVQPLIWISSWVDYSNQYGFGYKLSDGTVGVTFIDGSKIAVDYYENVYYVHNDKSEMHFHMSCYPPGMKKKIHLFRLFKKCTKDLSPAGCSVQLLKQDCYGCPPVLTNWMRYSSSVIMFLSNGTFQINFLCDHSKIIICPFMRAFTLIDHRDVVHSYILDSIKQNGCTENLEGKLRYALKKIMNMIDQKTKIILKSNRE